MATTHDKVRAGLFVVFGLALLAFFFLVIRGVETYQQGKLYYVTFTESVRGLEPGSSVTYKGVPVGRVGGMDFYPGDISRIRVELILRQDAPVKTGTIATLKLSILTGAYLVDLVGGTNGEADLLPGREIPPSPTVFGQLLDTVPEFVQDLSELSEALGEILGPANRKRVVDVLEGFAEFSRSSREQLQTASHSIAAFGKVGVDAMQDFDRRLQEILRVLQAILEENRAPLARGVEAFAATGEELRHIAGDGAIPGTLASVQDAASAITAASEELQRLTGHLDRWFERNQTDLGETVRNLREATRELRDAVESIRAQPSRLLRSPPPMGREIPDALPGSGGERSGNR